MAREKENTYFLHLQTMAQCACSAGQALQHALTGVRTFHTANEHLHEQQEMAQQQLQTLLHALLHAFITPMERENLYQIGEVLMALVHSLCAWGSALEVLDGKALRAVLAPDAAQLQAVLTAVEKVAQALPTFSHPQRELSTRLCALQKQLQLAQQQAHVSLRQWAARPMDAQKLHLHALYQAMQHVYGCARQMCVCVQTAVIQNT